MCSVGGTEGSPVPLLQKKHSAGRACWFGGELGCCPGNLETTTYVYKYKYAPSAQRLSSPPSRQDPVKGSTPGPAATSTLRQSARPSWPSTGIPGSTTRRPRVTADRNGRARAGEHLLLGVPYLSRKWLVRIWCFEILEFGSGNFGRRNGSGVGDGGSSQ